MRLRNIVWVSSEYKVSVIQTVVTENLIQALIIVYFMVKDQTPQKSV